jgi:hypothetical protein
MPMISTPLLICLAVGSAAIVIVLMMWKPRRHFPASGEPADLPSRDVGTGSMLLSLAATVGMARAQAEQSNPDGGSSWHGSHLHHGADVSGGSFHDGGGFGGGDAGGGI